MSLTGAMRMNSYGITPENLLRTLPDVLKNDEGMLALATAISDALAERPGEIESILIYTRIDSLPEELLDILAFDHKVDWWDANYPVEVKRRLLKESWAVRRRLGTVFSLKTALSAIYPLAQLEEWFEYGGGEPFHFRIYLDLQQLEETPDREKILRTIQFYKRLSAHLDGIIFGNPHAYLSRFTHAQLSQFTHWQLRNEKLHIEPPPTPGPNIRFRTADGRLFRTADGKILPLGGSKMDDFISRFPDGEAVDEALDKAHKHLNANSLGRIGGTGAPMWNGQMWPGNPRLLPTNNLNEALDFGPFYIPNTAELVNAPVAVTNAPTMFNPASLFVEHMHESTTFGIKQILTYGSYNMDPRLEVAGLTFTRVSYIVGTNIRRWTPWQRMAFNNDVQDLAVKIQNIVGVSPVWRVIEQFDYEYEIEDASLALIARLTGTGNSIYYLGNLSPQRLQALQLPEDFDSEYALVEVLNAGPIWATLTDWPVTNKWFGGGYEADFKWQSIGGGVSLDSPNLTGIPTAPTAPPGTNTDQIATTAFVMQNAGGGGGGVHPIWHDMILQSGATSPLSHVPCRYTRVGNFVFVVGVVELSHFSGSRNIATLPEGFRPSGGMTMSIASTSYRLGQLNRLVTFYVFANGEVHAENVQGLASGDRFWLSGVYPITTPIEWFEAVLQSGVTSSHGNIKLSYGRINGVGFVQGIVQINTAAGTVDISRLPLNFRPGRSININAISYRQGQTNRLVSVSLEPGGLLSLENLAGLQAGDRFWLSGTYPIEGGSAL
jgi:phage tail P2-like protein